MPETKVGEVFQFFAKPSVAAVRIVDGSLKVGDRIHIIGHTTDFTQTVDSMQVEKETVEEANAGDSIGIKVLDRVRPHDSVYKVDD
ncbi:MAG: translation elongation factor-like protein [Candidatus Altiarchaeales archaeon]|nr:translation elongation factor-like protein [Candidatus Altiarchaeales archaeon]MBD3415818.1 translation elongation factor-like protein [Candidatus Altiarchaeales archaeon]